MPACCYEFDICTDHGTKFRKENAGAPRTSDDTFQPNGLGVASFDALSMCTGSAACTARSEKKHKPFDVFNIASIPFAERVI